MSKDCKDNFIEMYTILWFFDRFMCGVMFRYYYVNNTNNLIYWGIENWYQQNYF